MINMLTDLQKQWLQEFLDGKKSKRDDPHTYSVYMGRIRDRVDHMMDNMVWLANNMPDLMKDEEWEIQEYGSIKHRRLKLLMQTIKAMYPESIPELARVRE